MPFKNIEQNQSNLQGNNNANESESNDNNEGNESFKHGFDLKDINQIKNFLFDNNKDH